ncbi:YozD family protein [Metabacillus arenae]|uniref:YozD family protein n=1 Tax=Metabacillus arenae TaxID=2771434 RepID=A0A926NEQ3_9BACI|nr:YozD family protein [Metabacillus arenae]MBD1379108.1 YozD family protein [Metabacillus arenae]
MKEIEISIDTEEIAEFLFDNLIRNGYSPTEDELDVVADIVFDFFIHKGIVQEEF